MSDRYLCVVGTPLGSTVARRLGLPRPAALRRYEPGQPLLPGPAAVVTVGDGVLAGPVRELLHSAGAQLAPVEASDPLGAVVLDATGAGEVSDLQAAGAALADAVRRLAPSGRVLVLARPPEDSADAAAAATRRALEGVVRSLGKELREGATANLLYVAHGAEAAAGSPVRFFLSARSAYVSGQAVRVTSAQVPDPVEPSLRGRVAVVTGAARGIGAAIAEVLSREGATVVGVDVPEAGEMLARLANRVGGTALQLDITRPDAPAALAEHVGRRHGGVDVVVHNAGITRDRLVVNLDAVRWEAVLAVNLDAQLRITDTLLGRELLHDRGRIVCVSSTSGIAGNRGQANYAASKAGIIGMVSALAPTLAARDRSINAVAPGFIETEMTAKIPFGRRELGRRINSLGQGGLPVDVAETVAWLAAPDSGGVNGQVVRVCGQSLLGA